MKPRLKKPLLLVFGIAILLGLYLAVSPGFILCLLLTAFLFYSVVKKGNPEERNFLLTVMVIVLLLRFAALIAMQYYYLAQGKIDIFGDGRDNLRRGVVVSEYIEGISEIREPIKTTYNTHGKTVFNGFFFALFGKDILSLKYLNFLFVLIIGWIVYDLTKRIYSQKAAKAAMIITLFWPTLFIWSLSDLKDNHYIFSIVIIVWATVRFISEKKPSRRLSLFLLAMIFSFYALTLRAGISLAVLSVSFAGIIIYSIFRYLNSKKNYGQVMKVLFLAFLCLAVFIFKGKLHYFAIKGYNNIIGINQGYLNTAGYNYDILGASGEFYTLKFFSAYFIKAWIHFLLEPFPWHTFSPKMVLILPLVFIWYILLFASLVGIIKICKAGKFSEIFFMLMVLFIYITACGMAIANIGTAIRVRDIILPFVAILSSCSFFPVPFGSVDSQLR